MITEERRPDPALADPARVQIAVSGEQLTVAPLDFLGRVMFGRYLEACRSAGAHYVAKLKAQVTRPEDVGGLIAALGAAGFHVQVAPEALEQIEAQRDALRATADAVRAAEAEIVASLEARGLELWRFQSTGVAWLRQRTAGVLGDEPGLGKTVQALTAAADWAPVLVIAPAVAKGVWRREAARWRPDLSVSVLSGRGSFRWPLPGELVVTNYDILPDQETLSPPPQGLVLIVDEAHALKSTGALRVKRFRPIAGAALQAQGRVWLLTGTPLLNRPPELWNLLNHVGLAVEAFGSFPRFRKLFAYGGAGRWGTPKAEAAELLKRVMLRRMRHEVLPDLPTKTYQEVPAPIDDNTRRLLDEFRAELDRAGVDLERVLSIPKGSDAFMMISRVRAALATAKIPTLLELVAEAEEEGDPILVFSAHRGPIDLLETREGWAVITGDTPPAERTAIEDRFQRGELRGVGLTIRAGGVAVTLTKAHRALFVDLEWTPALNAQAEDRICRIGQDRGVIITRIVGDHLIDQHVTAKLHEKQKLITASVDRASVSVSDPTEALRVAADRLDIAGRVEVGEANASIARRVQGVLSNRREGTDDELAALAVLATMRSPFAQSIVEQSPRGLTDRQWAKVLEIGVEADPETALDSMRPAPAVSLDEIPF